MEQGTLVLAFSGWMDGGDVSTGTVRRLVDLLGAEPLAEIDPESFFIYNFPGSMDVASLFRPYIEINDGVVTKIDMPSSTFYAHAPAALALFVGKEPNLRWRTFGDCIFQLARRGGHPAHPLRRLVWRDDPTHPRAAAVHLGIRRQSAGGDGALRRPAERLQGPGSFTSYLMTRAAAEGLEMVSLVAEIPGYLQGANPMSIEAVTRRLAKILQLSLDLDSLRAASTEWELQVSTRRRTRRRTGQKGPRAGATVRQRVARIGGRDRLVGVRAQPD